MRTPRGYTLVEILISMSIFGILGAITVFGFRGVGKANLVKQTSAELVTNLRMIQSLAMSGGTVMTCDNKTPLTACTAATVGETCGASGICGTPAAPPGGYGITVTANGYMLFANMPRTDTDLAGPTYDAAYDPVVTLGNVKLPADISIGAYEPNMTEPFYSPGAVTFSYPRGFSGVDMFFCISRPDFDHLFYKVSLFKDIGQILEESVDECPPTP